MAYGLEATGDSPVDLSLYDPATGREVEMPSAYDETSERASPD
jgi:D-alanyl-D-alanine dipeptidase